MNQPNISMPQLENLLQDQLALLRSGRDENALEISQQISDAIALLSPADTDLFRSSDPLRSLMDELAAILNTQLAQTRADLTATQNSRRLLQTYSKRPPYELNHQT
ncbi:MAG: hypothetical protein A2Y07_09235 [Planctomycetes bacterium GWF2_50_10]|nr:MAG: hypothetical protein A2Y07_09235 [Planctomycetes bacterium GWF2_50_10]